MSQGQDLQETGRLLEKAFADASQTMREFADVWNAGGPPPVAPMLSRIQAKTAVKPTD